MRFCLLLTKELLPVPENVQVETNFGEIQVIDENGKLAATGDHIVVQAEPANIVNWLRKYDGVWVCTGSPIQQKFQIMHIRN